jgi:uncharacterized protein YecE (DUF72 family)
MTLRIGTSGWLYRDWRGTFYPPALRTREWLSHYADTFDTVELNSTFYRLPDADRFRMWADTVGADFRFAVKASRYLTHVRRLQEPRDPVRRLMTAARGLGRKLGPVLLQLPPTLRADAALLDETLASFPAHTRVAVEFRHPSWRNAEVDAVLRVHDASNVLADRRGGISGHRTASWAYVRLHEGRAAPPPRYGRRALRSWAARLNDEWGPDVDGYVYFNNDSHGCAPRNALEFRALAVAAGMCCNRSDSGAAASDSPS